MPRVLIIDDERSIRNTLRDILEYERFEVDEAKDGEEGLEKIKSHDYDVVLCDVKMPKVDGLEVLERGLALKPEAQFIMISGHANIDTAVEATKKGAYDFIQKPPDLNRLLVSVRNALDKSTLVIETKTLRRRINKTREILGHSEPMVRIRETIARVAPTDARVLITGPNGTGKELVARWLHEQSGRAGGPLIEVNCAAIPAELIESELFGHEKGAFTSAVKQRIGKFEQAHGGTLFLDEIGDMSLSAQAKVLRALQENRIMRVGGEKEISLDVRVLAATNKDLRAEIDRGNFREDLYHRLAVIVIQVPPLRERADDLPELAQSFLSQICEEYGYAAKTISAGALALLQQHDWSGNVRELHNVIERLAIFAEREIGEADVQRYAAPTLSTAPASVSAVARHEGAPESIEGWIAGYQTFQDFKDAAEAEFIRRKLIKHQWNVTKTAEEIDIQRSHLYNKMEKYGLQREAK